MHSAEVHDLFESFISATTLKGVITTHRRICQLLELSPGTFNQFYPAFKKGIVGQRNKGGWKATSIFNKIDRKAALRVYHTGSGHHHHGTAHYASTTAGSSTTGGGCSNNILSNHNSLIVGGGPCGLRTAIELQLLGGRHVVIVEKRDRFSRNNVLHLWPFVITDLRQLAAKKFFGKFCSGSIDHVSIRQLQLILLKVALIIGCEFIENISFDEICSHSIVGLCNKENEPGPATASTDVTNKHAPTSNKRKCSVTSDLVQSGISVCEEDETDGNVCDTFHAARVDTDEEPLADSRRRQLPTATATAENIATDDVAVVDIDDQQEQVPLLESGTSDSDADSDNKSAASSNGDGKTGPASTTDDDNDREALKDRNSASTMPSTSGRDRCRCCCHLHSAADGPSTISSDYVGALAHFSITSQHPATASAQVDYEALLKKLHSYQFDVLIGADGRRNLLCSAFPRKEFRGKLAIAITCNLINTHTLAEAQIGEISGISFIYNQELFKSLYGDTGIDLENIVYYKDDCHYFVMTAKKSSLLNRGVLNQDFADTHALLAPDNINRAQLLRYAKDAAQWTTSLEQDFALNHYGEPDVAMFDFTSMYAAENACRAKKIVSGAGFCINGTSPAVADQARIEPQRKRLNNGQCCENGRKAAAPGERRQVGEGLLLMGLVGDSLLEPFWPTGSGCARGFLSAMDAAWMVRQWALKQCNTKGEEYVLDVLSERESIYRLLGQTKPDTISQNHAAYTINPVTRYPNLKAATLLPSQCKHLLYDDIAPIPYETRAKQNMAAKRARRATIASTTPFASAIREILATDDVELRTKTHQNDRIQETAKHQSYTPAQIVDDSATKELEDSYKDFEDNYRGLLTSSTGSELSSNLRGTGDSSTPTNNYTISMLSSSVPKRGHHAPQFSGFTDLTNSPSASNLATIGKSRAAEIELALRHRRQQQSKFDRYPGHNINQSLGNGHESAHNQRNHNQNRYATLQTSNLRSKAAWFLEQNSNNSPTTSLSTSNNLSSTGKMSGPSFANRIKDLEAKFSGDYNSNSFREQLGRGEKKVPVAAKCGSHVLSTATNLEQLLNPKYQEDKLKGKVNNYRKKNTELALKQHCITKMSSKTDWNKKRWDEIEKEAKADANGDGTNDEGMPHVITLNSKRVDTNTDYDHAALSAPPPKPVEPRPKELLDIFKGRKTEIEGKLTDAPPINKSATIARTTRPSSSGGSTRNGRDRVDNWIAMLKGELDDRVTSPKPKSTLTKTPVKPPTRSPFADSTTPKLKSPSQEKPPPKNCIRCCKPVPLVDRILLSGVLLHRSCVACSRCHCSLRITEIRPALIAIGAIPSSNGTTTTTNAHHDDQFLCILCSKNRVNNSRSKTIVTTALPATVVDTPLPPATTTNVKTSRPHPPNQLPLDRMTMSLDSTGIKPAPSTTTKQSPAKALNQIKPAPLFRSLLQKDDEQPRSESNDYETRLKERMRWKEQFLLNNNNIDFGPLILRTVVKPPDVPPPTTKIDSATALAKDQPPVPVTTPPEKRINERIEYENTSMHQELFDEDELTKMLNLETDAETDDETPDSESWQRSDSTDNDFDSDEFDVSDFEKEFSGGSRSRRHHRRQRSDHSSTSRSDKSGSSSESSSLHSSHHNPCHPQPPRRISAPLVSVEPDLDDDDDGLATGDEIDTGVLDGATTSTVNTSTKDESSTFASDGLVRPSSLSATGGATELMGTSTSDTQLKQLSSFLATTKCSLSSSSESESDTLADELSDKKVAPGGPLDDPDLRTPTLEDLPLLPDNEEEGSSSMSSLSCCDGTFEDLNLLSITEDFTENNGKN